MKLFCAKQVFVNNFTDEASKTCPHKGMGRDEDENSMFLDAPWQRMKKCWRRGG